MATLAGHIPNQPVTPRDANGISRITPKSDRSTVKAAWVTWVANKKAHLYSGGSNPGKFDHTGLTYADESGGFSGTTFTVTVAGGKFYIDGVQQATVNLSEGSSYRFDQSHSSNGSHPLKLSTTSNGTHGGGSEYTTGVTYNGTAGNAGAYTQITVAVGAPTLYYYCVNHSGMGGQANTP